MTYQRTKYLDVTHHIEVDAETDPEVLKKLDQILRRVTALERTITQGDQAIMADLSQLQQEALKRRARWSDSAVTLIGGLAEALLVKPPPTRPRSSSSPPSSSAKTQELAAGKVEQRAPSGSSSDHLIAPSSGVQGRQRSRLVLQRGSAPLAAQCGCKLSKEFETLGGGRKI